jgi:hypothetical protein
MKKCWPLCQIASLYTFEFERDGDGTLVTWRYLFYLKPGLGIGPKRLVFKAAVVDLIWNRMMTKTLVNLTQIITLRALQAGKR